MNRITIFLSSIIFIFIQISFGQDMIIHTVGERNSYKLAEIDSITFNIINDTTTSGTLTDIDGNVYQTIKIGNQWWMVENLKVTHYNNGDSIPNVIENGLWSGLITGAYCNYNNNTSNVSTYGRLYNWHVVNDSREIAPTGWHVPTDDEWKELEMSLGMSQMQADTLVWRGTNEGGQMKEAGFAHWPSPNSGATNSSGFKALPGGFRRDTGQFINLNDTGHWWAKNGSGAEAMNRALKYTYSQVLRLYYSKQNGYSIRCIKD